MTENVLKQNLELMTCEEFANFLGVKLGTIYVWMSKKQLPKNIYRKLGRKPIFIKSQVESWFLAGAVMEGGKNGKKI